MACPRNENLIRFVYNEAAADEMAQIQRHLENCEPCQEEVAAIRTLEEALPDALQADSNGKVSNTQCPNAMTLACYLDGSLSPQERQPVEGHLARCRSCLDEIVGAAERARVTANQFRKTPIHLLDQAVRLGHEPARSQDESLVERVRKLLEPFVSRPGWTFAGAGACAVVLLAVFLAKQTYQGEPGTGQRTRQSPLGIDKLAQPNQARESRTGEIVSEARLDLNREVKQALIDYDLKNPIASQKKLFAIIEEKAPQISIHKIKSVEIEPNLLIAIASVSDLGGQVRLRLYNDGFLVIGAES
jgi:anti-sigma factor RsiW